MYYSLKLRTHLSTHRSVPSAPNGAVQCGTVRCEFGHYSECVGMRHMCSWSNIDGTRGTKQIKVIVVYLDLNVFLWWLENWKVYTVVVTKKLPMCQKSNCAEERKNCPNSKFELKVDFGSVIMFNISKRMICYLLLTRIIKSNMIFMNFWYIGDFYWPKLTHGRFYRLEQCIIKIFDFSWN